MNPFHQRIADRASHRCEYCHAPEMAFNFPFEVEHIVPKSLQGNDEDENLALFCRSCNLHKANRIGGINRDTKLATRFFNPRVDQWHEHFQLLPAGEIVGKTMIGQVTVESFNMNAPAQIGARPLWMRWGLLP